MSKRDNLGAKSTQAVLDYLTEIGDLDAVDALRPTGGTGQGFGISWGSEVYGHTGFLIGHIPLGAAGGEIDIENAFTVPPDVSLKDTRVRITFDRFWVERFPGRGKHKILCEFTGKNQVEGEQEELRYAITTEAQDRSSAAISGTPIFLGVTVGKNGISFDGKIINVSSSTDDALLEALGSGTFQEGLGLLTMAQPALKPFVGLTASVVKSVLKRSKNKQIHFFKLGLDFAESNTSVALRHGSFVVVQYEDPNWNWKDYVWNAEGQQILHKSDKRPLGYNYVIFRVSPYSE